MSNMSNSSIMDYPPTGERLEPIGTENPAVYIEPRDNVINGGDVKKSQPTRGVGVGSVSSSAVDVHYASGMTTIRIAGTPVNKRKQMFEDTNIGTSSLDRRQNLKSNVPNSIKNSLMRNKEENINKTEESYAISTTIPFVPDINDDDIKPETVITDVNGNNIKGDNNIGSNNSENSKNHAADLATPNTNEDVEALYSVPNKRKRVKFNKEVVVNQDDRTTLEMGNEEEAKTNSRNNLPYSDNSDVVYTDGSMTEIMPQKDFSFMNNGFTPIVDEYELRQLSRRLSSKEKEGPALPAAPHIQSVDIYSDYMPSNSSDNKSSSDGSAKSKDSSNKSVTKNQTPKNLNSDKKKKKTKLSHRRLSCCLWIAICMIVLTVAALFILGILYAVRVASESDSAVIGRLTDKMSLVQTTDTDVFSSALRRSPSPNLEYYLVQELAKMTWQEPQNNTVLSWHKGGILKVVSLTTSAGGPLTVQALGDASKHDSVAFSIVLRKNNWYAVSLTSGEFCLVSFSVPADSGLSWSRANVETIKTLHQSHIAAIDDYT